MVAGIEGGERYDGMDECEVEPHADMKASQGAHELVHNLRILAVHHPLKAAARRPFVIGQLRRMDPGLLAELGMDVDSIASEVANLIAKSVYDLGGEVKKPKNDPFEEDEL